MANLRTNNLSGEQGQNAYRGSVFFDGDVDGLQMNSSDFAFGTGDFTVEGWFWWSGDGIGAIFDSRTTDNNSTGFFIGITAANEFYTYGYPSGTSSTTYNTIPENAGWNHFAVTRDGSNGRVFLNGQQVGSTANMSSTDYTQSGGTVGQPSTVFITSLYRYKGYISNIRVHKGEAIYTSNFTPPFTELKATSSNCVLLCCQDSDDPTQDATGKTITAAGTLATAGYLKTQPKVIPPYGVDAGNTFGGPIQQSSQGYMYFPTGRTEERGRGRGIIAGGSPGTDNNEQIEFINIQSDGVVSEFGELITSRRGCGGCSSSTRGLIGGGTASNPSPTFTNSMEFITIATTANGTDFGDLNNASRNIGGVSNSTRGLFAGGGDNPALIDVIDFFTIATLGNATDFGNLTDAKKGVCGVGSPTRGLFGGGLDPSAVRDIDLVTIASAGNATDFGDLTGDVCFCGGVSSPTRGIWGGGSTPSKTNIIDFVTIASAGNATDFGDLLDQRNPDNSQICSHTRGLFVGGENPGPSACNIIDAITIATTGNATNFGDIRTSTSQSAGCSDSHGGLS